MAALPSSVQKECGGCECGCCGVREGASSIAAFIVLGGLQIVTVEELLAEIGISLIGVFLAVGEEEWGTIHLFELAVTVYVGNPLRAFPILFASPKLVEPVL